MSDATLWWLLAGGAVALELATGTFYLLMVAVGLAVGALAAHAGLGLAGQIGAAAVVGGVATGLWSYRRARGPAALPAASNPDVNLDIGAQIHVVAWGGDRTARVNHRGSQWPARLAPGAPAMPGNYTVTAVEGNVLVLTPAATPPAAPC